MSKWVVGSILALCGQSALSQAVVVNILTQDPEATETDEIICERYASLDAESVRIDMELEFGDLLSSKSGEAEIEIACPPDSANNIKLLGNFRVVISNPEDADCRIDFLGGEMHVQSDGDIEINAGGLVMGTRGTQYSLRASRSGDDVLDEVNVFEGSVSLLIGETPTELGQGQAASADLKKKRLIMAPLGVSADERKRTAEIYTDFDYRKIARTKRLSQGALEVAKGDLYKAHLAVLEKPDDPDTQLQLAKQKFNYQLPNGGIYHVKKAGVQSESTLLDRGIDIKQYEQQLKPDNLRYLKTLGTGAAISPPRIGVAPGLQQPPVAPPPAAKKSGELYAEALRFFGTAVRLGDAQPVSFADLCKAASSGKTAARKALDVNKTDSGLEAQEARKLKTLTDIATAGRTQNPSRCLSPRQLRRVKRILDD